MPIPAHPDPRPLHPSPAATPRGGITTSRRDFLRLSGVLAAGLGLPHALGDTSAAWAAEGRSTPPGTSPHAGYASRHAFDEFYDTFQSMPERVGHADDLNETLGALAWGQSYIQLGLLRMYRGYGQRKYLDELIGNIDQVLASRDSERGVTDYAGASHPAWRAKDPYTAGTVDLSDSQGRTTLRVHSVRTPIGELDTSDWSYRPRITLSVADGTLPGTFKLIVDHDFHPSWHDEFDNLSMDPASPNYVVTRLVQAWPTSTLLTANDLRESPSTGSNPAPGTFEMPAANLVFAVHTGMITYPIAATVRQIHQTPGLINNPRYRAKAAEFTEACRQAVAVHDDAWRENAQGEGWYVFPHGSPNFYDGVEQPANQFLALGRTQLHLAEVTGDPVYADRAAKMGRTFKNDLVLQDNGSYTWTYWPTWSWIYRGWTKAESPSMLRPSYGGARQQEDLSHGHIDIDFAVRAALDGSVFNEVDLERFADTFTENMATFIDGDTASVWSYVDGTGSNNSLAFQLLSATWMPLAYWDSEIFDHSLATWEGTNIQPDQFPSGFIIFGVANLAWFNSPRQGPGTGLL